MIGGSPTGVVAVTGAGGFIGRALVAHLPARETRLLQRRTPVDGVGRQVVEGALEDEGAVERLVEGAGAVVHLAGRVQAPDEAAFMAANAEATERHADVARKVALLQKAGIQAPIVSTTLSVEQVVGQSAGEAGFTLDRVQARGADHVEVAIASARATALLSWIAELEGKGVVLEKLSISPSGATGTVSAQIGFQRAGS